ncbi:MAG TPA: hypothetical protein VD887_06205 [Allosphingosinicella sp.]|nr:hypothetical protein [Allosphingosinicella sp.]
MPEEALKQARQGPLAVLLLLCGLILGSAGPATGVAAEGPDSRLAQSRPAKALVALRTPAREAVAEDDDRFDDVPALDAAVVSEATGRPAPLRSAAAASFGPSHSFSSYRARAPPAA